MIRKVASIDVQILRWLPGDLWLLIATDYNSLDLVSISLFDVHIFFFSLFKYSFPRMHVVFEPLKIIRPDGILVMPWLFIIILNALNGCYPGTCHHRIISWFCFIVKVLLSLQIESNWLGWFNLKSPIWRSRNNMKIFVCNSSHYNSLLFSFSLEVSLFHKL